MAAADSSSTGTTSSMTSSIEVRPRDPGAPGIVGSLFVDAAQFDIVRMDFTFTRSSYVDRRLDYIRISLENGLWQGRFWLPFEQRVELPRQLPELDFPAGATEDEILSRLERTPAGQIIPSEEDFEAVRDAA